MVIHATLSISRKNTHLKVDLLLIYQLKFHFGQLV